MSDASDEALCISVDQGCAGEAFRNKRYHVVDLTRQTHQQYGINPQDVWSEMKCLLSYPIYGDEEQEQIIGVLNVDTDFDIQKSGFKKYNVIRVVSAYAKWISELL
jgi:hypothetical protein